jgi:Sulfatase
VLAVGALACHSTDSSAAMDRTVRPDAAAPGVAVHDASVEQMTAVGTSTPAETKPRFRTFLDLLVNRVHAVVHRDGRLVVSAGDVSFLKFVDGGWKSSWILGERDHARRRVAFVAGLSATLTVPLDLDGDGAGGQELADLQLRLALRARGPNQRLSVFVNDRPVGTVEVPTTYAWHELTVPAGLLAVGENRIRLTFRSATPLPGGRRSAAALEGLELGPVPAAREPPHAGAPAPSPAPPVAEVDLNGDRRRAFSLPGPSRLSFYVQVPPAGRLEVGYAATTPAAEVLVRVSSDGAKPAILFEGPLARRWDEGSWDLSPWAEQAVRIDLVSRFGGVAWAAPRLVVPLPPSPPVAAGIPHKMGAIFVWMVDTLRADKVHVYNPDTVVQTPHYDAFAADSTRFASAQVPGNWSLPSHASILTGVYPTVHKATLHESRLSREVPVVAELMRKGGYRTAMFSSNGYISDKWGFDRGWDETRNFIRENLPNGADYLWNVAKKWILANGPHRQFVYLATVEPHVIYNPKKQFLERYWKKPYHGPIKPVLTGIQLGLIKTGRLKVNATDKAYIEALHNAEITQSDALFGAFVADLKAAGLYDSSAVIVISDHGDEFWEHGDVGHAQSVHQELVHVPLMVHAPGIFPEGKVITADVEAMDLFPTMLDLAGIVTPPETQASSLVPLLQEDAGPRAAWSQNLGMSRGLKVGRYRLIHSGARLELYDEIADPREATDVHGSRPLALRQMRNVFALLAAYENRWRKREWGTAADVSEAFYTSIGD